MHGRGARRRGTAAALAAAGVAVAFLPGAALGDGPDGEEAHIDGYPTISGTPQAGEVLTATAPRWSPPDAEPQWSWLRCSGTDDVRQCRPIRDSDATTYRVADADVGRHLRALLVVTATERHGHDSETSTAYAYSPPTAAIRARPVPTPAPTPTPTPVVVAPPPPPVVAPPPPPVVTPPPDAGQVLGTHKRHRRHRPRMMRPAPVVRIRGWLTRTGARVTLLTVRAPHGARVRVRCYGRSCPRRHWARTTALVHLVPFEHRLRAGTRLVITVTKRGYIGKRSVLRVRRGRPPARVDRCLYPGHSRPRRCPNT